MRSFHKMTRSVAIDTSTLTAIDKSEVVRQLNRDKTSFSPVISWYPRIITVPMETEQLRRLRQLKRRSNIPHWRWLARTPVKILLVQLTYLSHKMSYSRHRFSFWDACDLLRNFYLSISLHLSLYNHCCRAEF